MKRFLVALNRPSSFTVGLLFILAVFAINQWVSNDSSVSSRASFFANPFASADSDQQTPLRYRRRACSCTRTLHQHHANLLTVDETTTSLCSRFADLRGYHQRIISISMYGPRDNSLFALNVSMTFLRQLIADMTSKYPEWILRIYHDTTISNEIVCSIECAHERVDFCNVSSLGNLGSLNKFMPSKVWRFLPVGDDLVDIMGSRDLDSPITQRELDAVNDWISTGKPWHSMRDNPQHGVPMLGGMWGFRPALNRTSANFFLRKILDPSVVSQYVGRGDQTFLTDQVWPHIQGQVVAHDSFLCNQFNGKLNFRPWPSRRPHPLNDTGCFVGCVRPCCDKGGHAFGECPVACRPKNHPDWTHC